MSGGGGSGLYTRIALLRGLPASQHIASLMRMLRLLAAVKQRIKRVRMQNDGRGGGTLRPCKTFKGFQYAEKQIYSLTRVSFTTWYHLNWKKRIFMTVPTKVRQRTLSWAGWSHSTLPPYVHCAPRSSTPDLHSRGACSKLIHAQARSWMVLLSPDSSHQVVFASQSRSIVPVADTLFNIVSSLVNG
jgi:hypothetical protein